MSSSATRAETTDEIERPVGNTTVASPALVPKALGGDRKKKKYDREFIFTNYPRRKIALRVAYHGHVHDGLAKQGETNNTVEQYVTDALMRLRLVPAEGPENFGRCGRTDKGVSALGNVLSFTARASSWPADDPQQPPLDYCNKLNSILPPTIRTVGFAYVADSFDARFSCVSRTYRYYFCHRGLNLPAMKKAAKYFLGEQNVRNFCKMDVVNVSNYVRHIISVGIYESELLPEVISYFEIRANSFLYHQIRCTMEVLFLVGRGLEAPEVVLELLQRGDAKPVYPLADGTPLILWECEFPGIQWQISHRAFQSAERELQDISTALLIRACSADAMRNQLFVWYAGKVDGTDGSQVVRQPPHVREVDTWAITGCDWTEPRTQDSINHRRRELFILSRYEEEQRGKNPQEYEGRANTSYVPRNYVKLLDRDVERTYDEQVSELSARKKARHDSNEAKKAAGDAINAAKGRRRP